jgi:hypothetical protein
VVHLDLLDTRNGNVLATSDERCDLCGSAEAGTLVETQSALLRRALEDIIQGPSRLVVDSQPAGALVLVDNQLIGTTPVDQPVLEGEHVVRVMLDGYVSDEREVKLQRGVRERLDLQLRRSPRLARSRSIGWATLFTGIPVLAAGVGLLIDRRSREAVRRRRPRRIRRNCPYVFNTDLGGAAALAAGAALITIGAMLLLRTRDRPQPRRPRAFIGPDRLQPWSAASSRFHALPREEAPLSPGARTRAVAGPTLSRVRITTSTRAAARAAADDLRWRPAAGLCLNRRMQCDMRDMRGWLGWMMVADGPGLQRRRAAAMTRRLRFERRRRAPR